VRIVITEERVQVHLALWQKVLGLMRDIDLPRADVSDPEVVAEPVREAMRGGLKIGLRIPWLLYVARTIRLDQVFIVRRRVPGLAFSVRNHRALEHVLLSTPEAAALAARLGRRDAV
jgi:hypothetical protein